MVDLIIKGAVVVTGNRAGTTLESGGVAVRNGQISHVDDDDELAKLEPRAARVVDASGHILMPGLINMHCHAGDSLFRGLVEDLALEPWLEKVWQAEGTILNPETTRLGATLGFSELLLSGVTTTMDMFWFPEQSVKAARDVGARVATGGIFIDGPGMDGKEFEARVAEAEQFCEEFGGDADVFTTVLSHGTYTVCPENLRAARGIAERHGALFSTHAAETKAEQADISNRYGRSVIRHLDHLGLLDDKTVLAHCVHVDDEEIEILARTGATVAHNPVSNLKLASGFAPVQKMLEAGVRVTLGTDGVISGNDLDMWMALRLAATLPKAVTGRADAVSTKAALNMVTIEAAKALGAENRIGSLEPGKYADMILVDINRAHAVPMFDPTTHLVYSTAKSDVRHVFVNGEQVVEDGRLTRHDLGDTLARVRALTPEIAASIS